MSSKIEKLYLKFDEQNPKHSFLSSDNCIIIPYYNDDLVSAGAIIEECLQDFTLSGYAINNHKLFVEPLNKRLGYSDILHFMNKFIKGEAFNKLDFYKLIKHAELRAGVTKTPLTSVYAKILVKEHESLDKIIADYSLSCDDYSSFDGEIFYLKLSDKGIKSLNDVKGLSDLTSLVKLDLSVNKLSSINVDNLSNLRYLDLSYNNFTKVPKIINGFESLEQINMSFNSLNELPSWLGDLTRLESLNLSYNYLKLIPDSLTNLSNLRYLNLWANYLSKLPSDIGCLNKLEVLDLKSNKITSIPDSIEGLANLRKLNINFNKLESLPKGIVKLSKLKTLIFLENQMTVPLWLKYFVLWNNINIKKW
ncbi:MAG: leucine-rich repeat domain-containing protein [Candidatus Nanoarchaeia archaeon]|jgi:Leucine-rich repeat (LRR) protein